MNNQKILIPVDCSSQSFNTVKYAGGLIPTDRYSIVLFHVEKEVPESIIDFGQNFMPSLEWMPISEWRLRKRDYIQKFMDKAKNHLVEKGFPDKSIKIKIQIKNWGVSRDILCESHKEYCAIIIGRYGVCGFSETSIGSVAFNVIEKAVHIPIAIIGGDPSPDKILLAFDGSKKALMAVDMIGELLSNSKCKFNLCQFVRSLNLEGAEGDFIFLQKYEDEWESEIKKKYLPLMSEAEKSLIKNGFSHDSVSYEILTRNLSRAGSIVQKATTDKYGTIVIGRRGLTTAKDFIAGRVTRKVLDLSSALAVWIIN